MAKQFDIASVTPSSVLVLNFNHDDRPSVTRLSLSCVSNFSMASSECTRESVGERERDREWEGEGAKSVFYARRLFTTSELCHRRVWAPESARH